MVHKARVICRPLEGNDPKSVVPPKKNTEMEPPTAVSEGQRKTIPRHPPAWDAVWRYAE
jgi:hypothetical protein